MNSETYVFGVSVSEKPAVGRLVGAYAASLGPGFLEAAVECGDGRFTVNCAVAYPLNGRPIDIRRQLEAALNAPISN